MDGFHFRSRLLLSVDNELPSPFHQWGLYFSSLSQWQIVQFVFFTLIVVVCLLGCTCAFCCLCNLCSKSSQHAAAKRRLTQMEVSTLAAHIQLQTATPGVPINATTGALQDPPKSIRAKPPAPRKPQHKGDSKRDMRNDFDISNAENIFLVDFGRQDTPTNTPCGFNGTNEVADVTALHQKIVDCMVKTIPSLGCSSQGRKKAVSLMSRNSLLGSTEMKEETKKKKRQMTGQSLEAHQLRILRAHLRDNSSQLLQNRCSAMSSVRTPVPKSRVVSQTSVVIREDLNELEEEEDVEGTPSKNNSMQIAQFETQEMEEKEEENVACLMNTKSVESSGSTPDSPHPSIKAFFAKKTRMEQLKSRPLPPRVRKTNKPKPPPRKIGY